MYEAYLVCALLFLIISWKNFQHLLHPHFILTVVLVGICMSDFLIRSYALETIGDIPKALAQQYQLALLLIISVIVAGSYVLALAFRTEFGEDAKATTLPKRLERTFWWVACTILFLELWKRIVASGWSVSQAIENSLTAYGEAPWNPSGGTLRNLGDDQFLYAVVTILLPLSGILFGYLWLYGRRQLRLTSVLGYVAALVLLVLNGTRAPVVIVLGTVVLFAWTGRCSAVKKWGVTVVMVSAIMAATSAMYLYRVGGFAQVLAGSDRAFTLVYHQDDNHLRILRSLHIASNSSERWDPATFFWTTVVNPVPRAIWPEKPALLQAYWGNYKTEWFTITFIGELVAMFGPVGGAALSIIFGFAVFILLNGISRVLVLPGGIIVYLLFAAYAYMVFRSLQNLTQFLYMPLFGLFMFWWTNKFGGARAGGSTEH